MTKVCREMGSGTVFNRLKPTADNTLIHCTFTFNVFIGFFPFFIVGYADISHNKNIKIIEKKNNLKVNVL